MVDSNQTGSIVTCFAALTLMVHLHFLSNDLSIYISDMFCKSQLYTVWQSFYQTELRSRKTTRIHAHGSLADQLYTPAVGTCVYQFARYILIHNINGTVTEAYGSADRIRYDRQHSNQYERPSTVDEHGFDGTEAVGNPNQCKSKQ
ncbi:hypothetical protein CSKR_108507 [Clonorchis sinensis]|uniref:Uncharacterized protein n=2 Tax=Clonorchis sinensis TaxID=79923 RepID=G7YEC9_CLOSI|nr:hypothetical protein CSKR_108507 [Clonorchis sinensis]GAA51312.1 hypothetical protein CLF_105877 [Clonorchis sinensis]